MKRPSQSFGIPQVLCASLKLELIQLFQQLQAAQDQKTINALLKEIAAVEAALLKFCPDTSPPPLSPPASQWGSIGPANFSGRIKCVAAHPTDKQTLYAGAADGGVWKSADRGEHWTVWPVQRWLAIGAIAVAPSSSDVVYAATGEDTPGWGPSYPGDGVYVSTDAGTTWTLTAPIASDRCTRVLVHPADPNTVYVAGSKGFHKSTNGGKSWQNSRSDHVSDAVMDPLAPDTLFAGVYDMVNGGIYTSTDGGKTWNGPLKNGVPSGGGAGWIKLAAAPNFLVAKMGPDATQMFTSTNGGTGWLPIAGELSAVAYFTWTSMIAVDPSNPLVILNGAADLERSADGGQKFVSIGGTHADHHQLVFDPADSQTCYLATDGGVYRSEDNGKTWALKSEGLVATQLMSIGVAQAPPDDARFLIGAATQDQGIVMTRGPMDWVPASDDVEWGTFRVDPADANKAYITPAYRAFRRSLDNAKTWTTIDGWISQAWIARKNGFTDVTADLNRLTAKPLELPGDEVDAALYVGCIDYHFSWFGYVLGRAGIGGQMAWEYWNGAQWASLNPLYEIPMPDVVKNFAGLASKDEQYVEWVFDKNNYRLLDPPGWQVNAVNGVTMFWIRIRVAQAYAQNPGLAGARIQGHYLNSIAVHPSDGASLLCARNLHVFRSTNNGTSWTTVLATGDYYSVVAYSPSDAGKTCYAATTTGQFFRSTNAGTSWQGLTLPGGNAAAMAVDWKTPTTLYVGYGGYGGDHVWTSADGGQNWTSASGVGKETFPDLPVNALMLDQYHADTIYAATDVGVWRTQDGGASWQPFDQGMADAPVSDLALHTGLNSLFASTMGRGGYRRDLG